MLSNQGTGQLSLIKAAIVLVLALAGLAWTGFAQHELFIPQFADGTFTVAGEEHVFRTTLSFTNRSSATSGSLQLTLFANDGEVDCAPVDGENPFCVSLVQLAPQRAFLGDRSRLFFLPVIPPGGTLTVATRGDQRDVQGNKILNAGWAKIEANVDISGTAMYQIFRGESAQAISQTTIELTEREPRAFSIDVNINPGMSTNTGLTISNPSARSAVNLTLTLRDSVGTMIPPRTNAPNALAGYLPPVGPRAPGEPHNRIAMYITELFDISGSYTGTLSVSANGPVVAIALRQVGLELIPVAVIPQ